MEFIKGKYRIVTGITTEYKINPQNPKYFAKFVNDNIMTLGHTEDEAIERLKNLYEEYKSKNKLHPILSDQVLNPFVPKEKFEKYFLNGISIDFFELIGEDSCTQIDDEYNIKDLELSTQQIELINTKYNIQVNEEDIIVNIFEQIEKSWA
ncbi:hypothetical protein [Flavobacterium aurantiibacter]|uniref:Uncharacterized protein n=1 Tax=Flavobacterium aurantiibacter TaxID=2023067 RepID=A0A255ZGE2_9FLAO|nr:hypothetical protein [Flavobacterium aurantiibacter]OYQ39660.1 hypothetical protein CHX27_13795 [Flavobacterium aurantiibacter]